MWHQSGTINEKGQRRTMDRNSLSERQSEPERCYRLAIAGTCSEKKGSINQMIFGTEPQERVVRFRLDYFRNLNKRNGAASKDTGRPAPPER
jgi:hypothetical protein